MKLSFSLLTFSFLILTFVARATPAETSPTPASAKAAPSVADPSVQSAIVAAVENDRKRFGGHTPVPATLIGIWDSKGHSFIRAFGDADLEKKVPLTPADHFRIGSNTKTFVISVLLQLVAEKKLSLDDPLSRFSLGVTIPNAGGITVRELCNMRSGLFEAYDTPEFAQICSGRRIACNSEVVEWSRGDASDIDAQNRRTNGAFGKSDIGPSRTGIKLRGSSERVGKRTSFK